LNSLSTNSILSINNLNATSTSLFNKTNFTNLYVSGASTLLSSLNISGATTLLSSLNVVGNIIGSGTALTNLNYNAILNPPTLVSFNNPSTFVSTLNVSGNTTLNNATTIRTTLNVLGDINTSGLSVFGINTTLSTKQNNLTFSNPFLNTSNTISLKYDNTKLNVDASGNLTVIGGTSQWTTTGTSIFYNTGKVGIGTTGSINASLDVLGVANIHNGTRFATLNFNFNPGSLIIGSSALNYGGGTNWNGGNAAGLMMECDNNTEIVVHDNANRLASLMYYEGNTTNRITIGRNMGWDAISSIIMNGNVTVNSSLFTTANITIGLNNSYPDLRFGSANGNNIGIATTAAAFSSSSGVNDMVIRSINKLILQSGGGVAGLIIDTNNYTALRKILKFSDVQVADDIPFMNDLIFNKGAIMGGVFAGDMFITNYWGVSILLNSG
jgi:hypothetical protein